MKKKYYTFMFLIFILLFLLYNIIAHKYKEYKINEHITIISELNNQIKGNIKKAKDIIEYKSSKAYKNKILKSDKGLKNKGEIVIYLTTEDKYNKYISKSTTIEESESSSKITQNGETFGMTIYQKWLWFVFHKDLR